jgi:uncharacterized protein YhfF
MTRRKRMQLWGENEQDDHLILEVLAGLKTATVCIADEYHLPEGEFDDGGWEVGDIVDLYDMQGRLRCVIEITEVYRVAFGSIPDKLWRAEACRDAEHFREAHRRVWPDEELSDAFELMATHFRLVEVVP